MPKRYVPLVLLCVAGVLGAEPKRDRFGDPLPEGAIARLGSLRFRGGPLFRSPVGHDWFIREIHFSQDCKRLLSNTSGDIFVWDVRTSKPVASYRAGRLQQWFATSANGEAIRYLDWISRPSPTARKEKKVNERGLEEGEEKRPSGTETRTIYRWDLATDRKRQDTVFSIPAACDWFELSPDGQRVASVILSPGPKIVLSDIKGDKPAVEAALPDNSRVNQVLFSPDGRRLLVQTWYGAVRVLDSTTGQLVRDLKPGKSGRPQGSALAFAPDGRSVVLHDDQLHIREVASGKDRLLWANQSGHPAISPNGRFLILFYYDNSNKDHIRVLSTATGKELAHWSDGQPRITALGISPDSRLLASGNYDGTLLLWKLPDEDGLPVKLSKEEGEKFWQALADDAVHANRALVGLTAAPAQAIPLIRERFPTTWSDPDGKQIARWIAELDADDFKVREQATRELCRAGAEAATALRRRLTKSPSAEAKRRIENILLRIKDENSPKYLRAVRAVEVLERIGSPQAKDVLRALVGKSLPPDLREEVQASLRRLAEKP